MAVLVLLARAAVASDRGTLTVRVRNGAAPIPAAEVTVEGATMPTDPQGNVSLELDAGPHELLVSRLGFRSSTTRADVRAGEVTVVVVQLDPIQMPTEVVTVLGSRSGRIVEDQPVRVETVPEEELEENLTVAPGNVSTLLSELPGVHLQAGSSSLGGASLRLQGLSGRYTQILSDELPLFGDRPDVFGVLQVPPLDLAHVELIKGPASALYGGSALGGVLDLISRRPPADPEALLSATSLGGADAVGFVPVQLSARSGMTALGGAHDQDRKDINEDGWVESPGYRRAEIRPRFFWSGESGASIYVTAGYSGEDREGGTVDGGTTPLGDPFAQTLDTRRADVGLVGRFLVGTDRLVVVRSSFTDTRRDLVFGASGQHDDSQFGLLEGSVSGTDGGHTWLVGAAVERDVFRVRDLEGFDTTHTVPAVFLQDEISPASWFSLSASGRVSFPSDSDTVADARVSLLFRPAPAWTVRLSAGTAHAQPVPKSEKTDVVGLSRVLPFDVTEQERARGAILDAGWNDGAWEVTGTLFASDVSHPLLLRDFSAQPGALEFVSAPTPTRTYGAELLTRLHRGSLQAIASYTYLHSVGEDGTSTTRQDVPLTPWHSGELAAIWEKEGRGRFGVELSYTGRQRLEDDPYREIGSSFVTVNALGEIRFGETGVFVNAINVTDVRQSDFDPLVRPTEAPDGSWTTDPWAPLEGRVFNVGARWEF